MDSPDAKNIINFVNEIPLDIPAPGKSARDRNHDKNCFNK